MKYFLLILVLIVSCIKSFCQVADNTNLYNSRNIYFESIAQYIKYIQESKKIKIDSLYIEDDSFLTDSLQIQSEQTKIFKMTFSDIQKKLRIRKSLVLCRIFPLQYQNGNFFVSIVPFTITKRKKRNSLHFVNPGSYRMVYKFINDRFEFVEIEDHGI